MKSWLAKNWADVGTLIMAFGVLASAVFYVGQVSSKVQEDSNRLDRQADKIHRMDAEDMQYKKDLQAQMLEMRDKISHIDQWVTDHE